MVAKSRAQERMERIEEVMMMILVGIDECGCVWRRAVMMDFELSGVICGFY